ncbi:protein AGENET DOMAIN (AGD)-CONTAINING P1 [Andrographis paniculata]|uniref:protein AGENET DOMAIN (AGD)-CONTAINING P1 n=1 Tax=Andrographis paniculata TaxID=175694 RepID=UPI0021E9647A|nr:protein AGENET DOMAIN (AGD)-CONTAINING P1 [Andrographis paniculata]
MRPTPPQKPPNLSLFHKGQTIEVLKPIGNAAAATLVWLWYPATFLRSSPPQVYVQFDTLSEFEGHPTSPPLREYVRAEDVRPTPPSELHRYFKVGELVEGFCWENKGWRKGTIVDILEKSRYAVSFEEGDAHAHAHAHAHKSSSNPRVDKLEPWEVRSLREWVDGSWHPPLSQLELNKPSVSKVTSRGLILRIKCSGNASATNFNEGMLVEVKSDEEGFQGSWFTAVIVKLLGNNKFLVEYRTLTTDDKTELLIEEVDISCIRHCPPVVQRVMPFDYLEKVDAWYNDGWWEGYIVQVFNSCKYMVHFMHTDEDMVFEHCKLRSHQEWIDGKWFPAAKVNISDAKLRSNKIKLKRKRGGKASEVFFKNGLMVEVRSDEDGYHGSWYTAVIVCSLPCGIYLVEYQTLKTEDESKQLQEKAFASHIRPCPPKILHIDRFKMLENVDAWYNDGWWVGLVSKVVDGLKYAVYFWTTNEEIMFEHFSLRPHQQWIGGKWIKAARNKSKVPVTDNLGKCQGEDDGNGVEEKFMNGAKVEVKSDEQGCGCFWYPGSIVKPLGIRKYLVKYQTLKAADGTQLHQQEADGLCIRPCPPVVQRREPFRSCEVVDAWYNDGWRVGQICNALERGYYKVYFDTTKETLQFQHYELRPHLDWINGQWVSS